MAKTPSGAKSEKPAAVRRDVTWRLFVAYRGDGFVGWQRQEGQRSVQGELEKAFATIAGEEVFVRGAGRTDKGVHARRQGASLRMTSSIRADQIVLAMNSMLDDDVAVIAAQEMPHGFSAKRHSVGKHYRYRIYQGAAKDPFLAATHVHSRRHLDVDAMRAATQHLVGELDFESFRSVHCDAAHARRYLWAVNLHEKGRVLELEVRGNAFCRYMIRIIAGTLIDVGNGRFAPDDVKRMLEAKDRTQAGTTAPAHGLTLEEVFYPDTLDGAGIPDDAVFPGFPVTEATWPPVEHHP